MSVMAGVVAANPANDRTGQTARIRGARAGRAENKSRNGRG